MFILKKKKLFSVFQIDFIIFQPKHILLILKMYVKIEEKENIYNFPNVFYNFTAKCIYKGTQKNHLDEMILAVFQIEFIISQPKHISMRWFF